MKRLITFLLSLSILFLSVADCSAADIGYSMLLDSKIQTGKSFSAEIAVSGGVSLSAMIFTVKFDPSVIDFSKASVIDGADGMIEEHCENGSLKIVFLSPNGIGLSGEGNNIIEIKFKARQEPCNTYLTVYGEQAVSGSESRLSCDYGVEYRIELANKVSDNVGRAGGTAVSGSSSSKASSSSASSGRRTSSSSASKGGSSSKDDTSFNNSENITSLGATGSTQSDNALFICGFIAALCLACGAAGLYALGKKRGEAHRKREDKNDESTSGKDNKETEASDNEENETGDE